MKHFIYILIFSISWQFSFSQKEKQDDLHWGYDFINYTVEDGLPSNETYSIVQDNDGYLWISSDNGVSRYNGYEFENFTIDDGLIDNTIFRMFKDEKGRIWMPGYNGKLCYYENGEFVPYEFNYVLDSISIFNVNNNNILEVYVYDDIVSVNYTFGFVSLDKNGKLIKEIEYKKNINKSLYKICKLNSTKSCIVRVSNGVNQFLISGKDTIHKDTSSPNSHHLSVEKNGFNYSIIGDKVFVFKNNEIDSLSFFKLKGIVTSLVITDRELMSLGMNGLTLYNKKNLNDYKVLLSNVKFSTGINDINNGVWLTSLTNGIFYITNQDIEVLYNNKRIVKKNNGLVIDRIFYSNCNHRNDSLFKEFKKDKSRFKKIFFKKNIDNVIYLSTLKGLFLYSNNTFKEINLLDNVRVNDLVLFKGDTILATKGKGVYILRNDTTLSYTEKNGLLSNNVNNIFVKNDKIWISTGAGVNSLNYNEELSSYSIKSELTSFEGLSNSNVRKVFLDSLSDLYIHADNRFYKLDYESFFKKKPFLGKVLIKKTLVNGIKYNNKKNIFKYNQNNFNIKFEAISFSNKSDIKYRYKLIGLFSEWEQTKTRNVNFYKLPPNKYRFEIQYQLPNMDWSQSTLVDFSIKEPYWKTWWFRLLSILSIILVLFFLFLDYNKRKKLQLDFLKSSQTALASQMNPHFVFNAMNSLQNYMLKNENDLAQKYLIKFSRLIRIVFENSKENYICLSKELNALNLYLELEKKRFDNKFEYKIELNVKDDVFVPPLIIQPFVENAIWHGLLHLNTNGILNIKIEKEKTKLKVSINDNGIGIEKSKALKSKSIIKTKKSSGISNSKKRIKLLEKQYKTKLNFELSQNCKDCENVGTVVIFELPLFYKKPQV